LILWSIPTKRSLADAAGKAGDADGGGGGQSKSLLSFSGERLNLRRTDAHGREVSVDGEQAIN
jgi:hypothetical protein